MNKFHYQCPFFTEILCGRVVQKKQKVYFSVLRGYYAEFKKFVKDVHFKSAQFHNLLNFLLDQGFNEKKKRLKDSVSRQRDMPSALSIVNGRH